MQIDKEVLEGKDLRAIINQLIQSIRKTDAEIQQQETRQGPTKDLKLYVVDAPPETLGKIEDLSYDVLEDESSRQYARNFFNSHIIEEEKLNQDIWWVSITTPRYERTDEFVFAEYDEYLWVLTTELKDWAEDTVENLIRYLPQFERVFLPSDDLEDVMDSIIDSRVSGFTAKYHAPYRDRDATLRFHGAEPEDLAKAEETFGAKPTRIEFDQQNSPAVAIQGSGSSEGILTLESVRMGSEGKAVETLWETSTEFTIKDTQDYAVETDSKFKFFEDGGGLAVDEFTSIELYDPDREDDTGLREELEESLLSKNRYRHGNWGEDTYFVYDTEHEEVFELGIESERLVLHARETTTSLSLRSFCKAVLSEFDSTYSIRKKETKVAV